MLGNDCDYDGDPMTAVLVGNPSHAASFTLNADGSFDYTPAYHYVGEDSFTYQAFDGIAPSTTATVALNVYNNPTVANDDFGYIAASGVALSVSAGSGVCANDCDPDGDLPLMAALASNPSHGEIHLYDDGSFAYTSTGGYAGTDSFTYYAFDGIAISPTPATVTITVFRVDHETVATVPADRTRTKLGVGERVACTVVPSSVPGVTWYLAGGGTIDSNSGRSTTLTADEMASESHVQAVVANQSYTVHFNVVEPTGETAEGAWCIRRLSSMGF